MDDDRNDRVDKAVRRHPASGPARTGPAHAAGPGGGYGMRVVRLSDPVTLPVYGERESRRPEAVIGYVDLPAVHVQECTRCGSLHRIGSPFALTHTLHHRWETWGRRARAALHSVTRIGRAREAG